MTPEPFLHFRVFCDGTPLGVAMASTPEEACAFVRMNVSGAETGELRAEQVPHSDDGWFSATTPPEKGTLVAITYQTNLGRHVDWYWSMANWLPIEVVAWRAAPAGMTLPRKKRPPEPFSCGPIWTPEVKL